MLKERHYTTIVIKSFSECYLSPYFLFMMILTETVFYSTLSFIFSYQKIEMGFRAKLLQYLEPCAHHLIVILSTSLLSGQYLQKTNIFQDSAHRQGQWGLLWPMHPSTLVMPRPAVLADTSNTASPADWRTPRHSLGRAHPPPHCGMAAVLASWLPPRHGWCFPSAKQTATLEPFLEWIKTADK